MTLEEAAAELGVHYQTAYRWLRSGALLAVKVNGVYEVTPEALAAFKADRQRPVPMPERRQVRDWERQVDRFYELLVNGQEPEADQLVADLREGVVETLELCDQLFLPTLMRVGRSWLQGKINMAEQHRGAAIAERVLARSVRPARGRPRGVAVVATAPGDEHTFLALMATLVLRADRWRVHHIGREIPGDELADFARAESADVGVVSFLTPAARPAATHVLDALREAGTRPLLLTAGVTLSDVVEAARPPNEVLSSPHASSTRR